MPKIQQFTVQFASLSIPLVSSLSFSSLIQFMCNLNLVRFLCARQNNLKKIESSKPNHVSRKLRDTYAKLANEANSGFHEGKPGLIFELYFD